MGKTAKYTEIILDKPRRMLYDLNAMAAYEEKTGKSFLDIPKEQINATMLRVILWAGLIHEDKTLTLDQVGAMTTAENLGTVQNKIVEASLANNPEPSEGSDPNAPKPEVPVS